MAKLIIAAALLATAASAASLQISEDVAFNAFVSVHGKQYKDAADRANRKRIFADNMRRAADLQKQNPLATFGINEYSDMTAEEFKTYHNANYHYQAVATERKTVADIFAADQIKAGQKIDWRTKGAVTAVKNQGQCGSCWSFSTTGNIEGQWKIAGHELVSLSEQELVSCDNVDSGCGGGLMTNAMGWLIKNTGGWIATEASFPYVSGSGNVPACRHGTKGAQIKGSKDLPQNENQMAQWMMTGGPIAIAVDATSFQTYTSGILTNCISQQIDHGVLAVGFDDNHVPPYWIIKNSWGPSWGENGYIRVAKGTNQCLITTVPCTAIV